MVGVPEPHPLAAESEDRFEFDRDTAVEPLGDGRFRTEVSSGWNIGTAPNGGYLTSVAIAAMARSVPHPDPLSVSVHFPNRVAPGPAELHVEVLRAGRGLSTVVGRLVQEGEPRVHVTATFGDLSRHDGPTAVTAEPPALPPPEACVPVDPAIPGVPVMMERLDMRLTPESAGFAIGHRRGEALMEGWIRFRDGREPDTRTLVLTVDSFPPTVFGLMQTGWVPTIELTAHVRGRPAPGWLAGTFRTRFLVDGYLEEDGEVWDSTGRLVALSRQLARVLG
jgi:acyl-CoA thioesterase